MRVVPSPAWAVADADVVIVAVKPGDVAASLQAAESSLRSETLVLSIAAGVTIATLEALVPGRPVVRAMPNTPALVGLGASAIAAGRHADEHHLELASRLLGAVGIVVTVGESALDAVTGLSGSGPAYIFLVAEAMIEAGVLVGLARDVSEQLVVQTLLGSATLLAQSDDGPEALRAAVTSPGGTTAAGLRELESARLRGDPRRGQRGDAPVERARRARMSKVAQSPTASRVENRASAGGAAADPGRSCWSDRTSPGERSCPGRRRCAGWWSEPPAIRRSRSCSTRRGPRCRRCSGPRARIRTSIPILTIAAAQRAVARIIEVASTGAHISLATSRPASLITFYLALARLARISGGDVADDADSPPLRADGRAARGIRWVDGVAMVTDGQSLCSTRGPEAPQEWLFLVPRPALVVADGPFADVALDAGIEVIAPAGLDHCSLAVARRDRAAPRDPDVDRPVAGRVPPAARGGAQRGCRFRTFRPYVPTEARTGLTPPRARVLVERARYRYQPPR